MSEITNLQKGKRSFDADDVNSLQEEIASLKKKMKELADVAKTKDVIALERDHLAEKLQNNLFTIDDVKNDSNLSEVRNEAPNAAYTHCRSHVN